MNQSAPNLKSILRTQFSKRILAVFLILFATASLLSTFEIWVTLNQFKKNLRADADSLQHLVVSEILVNNSEAIDTILSAHNRKLKPWTVIWVKDQSDSQELLSIGWDGMVRYHFPLSIADYEKYGEFVFESPIINHPEILGILGGKLLLLLVALSSSVIIIFPLARRLPHQLIAIPLRNILNLVQNPNDSKASLLPVPFQEWNEVEDELRGILNSKHKLEQERAELQKIGSVAQTAQMLAHDMRKPIHLVKSLIAGLQAMTEAKAMQSFAQESSKNIQNAFNHMDALLKELSQLGTTKQERYVAICLRDLCNRIVSDMKVLHESKRIKVQIQISPGIIVDVEPVSFERAVSNLLTNAYEACNVEGSITLEAKLNGNGWLSFSITNSGSFIPVSDRGKIFQIFYTSGKELGTGLGLAIVLQIVKSHGGVISVESEEEFGTTFTIQMPCVQQNKPTSKISKDNQIPVSSMEDNPRILLIDDDAIYLQDLRLALSQIRPDAEIITCEKSSDVLDITKHFRPHLIVSDVHMGQQMNGFELVHLLRSHGNSSAIVIHSNAINSGYEDRAYEAGANLFFDKVDSIDTLDQILNPKGQSSNQFRSRKG